MKTDLSSSIFRYDLYQYMYDTIDMLIYQKDVPDMCFLEDIPQLLTTAQLWHSENGDVYIKGKLNSMNVYINSSYLKITGSLSKYCHGNNLEALPFNKAQKALLGIGLILGISLECFNITRLDIAANLVVEEPVTNYFPFLYDYRKHKMATFENGFYRKASNFELAFYDKNKEMKSKAQEYRLRYELRLKSPVKVLNESVTAAKLCDPVFWNRLLDLWFEYYVKIEKMPKSSYDCSGVTGKKDVANIAMHCLFDNNTGLFRQLNIAKDRGTMNKYTHEKTKRELAKVIFSPLPERKHDLIEELDMKMKAVVEQFKQQI